MATAAPKGGGTEGNRTRTRLESYNTRAAPAQPIEDLPALRARLVGVRRRLLERLAEDWPDDRRFPDSAWCRMLSDVHEAIGAVDAVIAEGGP